MKSKRGAANGSHVLFSAMAWDNESTGARSVYWKCVTRESVAALAAYHAVGITQGGARQVLASHLACRTAKDSQAGIGWWVISNDVGGVKAHVLPSSRRSRLS
jgi:hypothetical protein